MTLVKINWKEGFKKIISKRFLVLRQNQNEVLCVFEIKVFNALEKKNLRRPVQKDF